MCNYMNNWTFCSLFLSSWFVVIPSLCLTYRMSSGRKSRRQTSTKPVESSVLYRIRYNELRTVDKKSYQNNIKIISFNTILTQNNIIQQYRIRYKFVFLLSCRLFCLSCRRLVFLLCFCCSCWHHPGERQNKYRVRYIVFWCSSGRSTVGCHHQDDGQNVGSFARDPVEVGTMMRTGSRTGRRWGRRQNDVQTVGQLKQLGRWGTGANCGKSLTCPKYAFICPVSRPF